MPRQFQQPNQPETIRQKIEFAEGLAYVLALPMIVIFRTNPGLRTINLPAIASVEFVVVLIAPLVSPDQGPGDLILLAIVILLAAFIQKLLAWRRLSRGTIRHSYHPGDSRLRSPAMPGWLQKNRRLERFFDPALCILGGLSLRLFGPSHAAGVYLIGSGLALKLTEEVLRRHAREEGLNLMDGIIHAQAQSEFSEQLLPGSSPANTPAKSSGALPTGIGDDVKDHIERQQATKRGAPRN